MAKKTKSTVKKTKKKVSKKQPKKRTVKPKQYKMPRKISIDLTPQVIYRDKTVNVVDHKASTAENELIKKRAEELAKMEAENKKVLKEVQEKQTELTNKISEPVQLDRQQLYADMIPLLRLMNNRPNDPLIEEKEEEIPEEYEEEIPEEKEDIPQDKKHSYYTPFKFAPVRQLNSDTQRTLESELERKTPHGIFSKISPFAKLKFNSAKTFSPDPDEEEKQNDITEPVVPVIKKKKKKKPVEEHIEPNSIEEYIKLTKQLGNKPTEGVENWAEHILRGQISRIKTTLKKRDLQAKEALANA